MLFVGAQFSNETSQRTVFLSVPWHDVRRDGRRPNEYGPPLTCSFFRIARLIISISLKVGGLLVSKTGDMLSVFYLALDAHILFAIVIWFWLPESLSPRALSTNQGEVAAAKLAVHERHEARLARDGAGSMGVFEFMWKKVWWAMKSAFGLITPLAVFLPRKREVGESGYEHGGRDWNLTCIALAQTSISTVVVSAFGPCRATH
jgi:hypothetical protein